jgi:signal transduction histidine kinase
MPTPPPNRLTFTGATIAPPPGALSGPAPASRAPAPAGMPVATPAAAAPTPRRRRLALSIRLRLTLWNVAILTGVLLLFGISVYAFFAISLNKEIDDALQQQYSQIRDGAGFYLAWDRTGGLRLFTDLRPDRFGSDQLDLFIQIASLEGRVPDGGRSSNLGELSLPISRAVLDRVREGSTVMEEVIVGGHPMRLYSGPFYLTGPGDRTPDIIGVIQVARSLERTERTMTLLRLLLIGGGLTSLAVAAVVGLALSGAALRPLDRLTQAARAIGAARDFSRRVEPPPADDEVGQLAHTFNEMLAQLQAAHNGLAASLDAQRRFVADASHELRTPLTTIRGNVGLLRRVADVDPADQAAALADIESEAERMSRLVTQLLSLARADAGATLDAQPIELKPIILDSGRQLALLAGSAGLTSAVEVADAPVRVLGDSDALRQLLLILIDNAVKYTPAPGTVRLTLGRDGGEAVIQVADTGIGIAPADQPRIFERFYRADPARSGSGAGLGLAIARWLVEAQQGRIEVDSVPGQGSIFRVRLPLLPEA